MGQRLTPEHPGLKKIQAILNDHFTKHPPSTPNTYPTPETVQGIVETHRAKGGVVSDDLDTIARDHIYEAHALILDNLEELVGRQD